MAEEFSPAVLKLYEQLKREAEEGGYNLNPDRDFTLRLVAGLVINEERYGYRACPCRLAHGDRKKDIDIICPCYYRDADLEEFGACYCALYVSDDWLSGNVRRGSIPERRPAEFFISGYTEPQKADTALKLGQLALPVWRCKVCGYLCARSEPPGR